MAPGVGAGARRAGRIGGRRQPRPAGGLGADAGARPRPTPSGRWRASWGWRDERGLARVAGTADPRDREPVQEHGRRGAGAAVDVAHRRAVHVLQPDLAGLHRPFAGGGVGRRLGRGRPLRGLPALHGHLRRRLQPPRGVRDGVPAAAPRRRVPLDPRSRHAPLPARRNLRRLHRLVRRHHRAPAAGGRSAQGRQGARRVPVDRVARAAHAADVAEAARGAALPAGGETAGDGTAGRPRASSATRAWR